MRRPQQYRRSCPTYRPEIQPQHLVASRAPCLAADDVMLRRVDKIDRPPVTPASRTRDWLRSDRPYSPGETGHVKGRNREGDRMPTPIHTTLPRLSRRSVFPTAKRSTLAHVAYPRTRGVLCVPRGHPRLKVWPRASSPSSVHFVHGHVVAPSGQDRLRTRPIGRIAVKARRHCASSPPVVHRHRQLARPEQALGRRPWVRDPIHVHRSGPGTVSPREPRSICVKEVMRVRPMPTPSPLGCNAFRSALRGW